MRYTSDVSASVGCLTGQATGGGGGGALTQRLSLIPGSENGSIKIEKEKKGGFKVSSVLNRFRTNSKLKKKIEKFSVKIA